MFRTDLLVNAAYGTICGHLERRLARHMSARGYPMKSGWAAAGLPVLTMAVLGLGLGGCGGGPGQAAGGAHSFPAPDPKVLTPPGTHLKIGQGAVVGYVPLSRISLKPQRGYRLEVTVESLQRGRVSDFPADSLDARERKSTPYYARFRIKALGGNPLKKNDDDPAQSFDAVDYHGQQPEKYISLGNAFSRCSAAAVPPDFANGKSYESCVAFLMPVGGPPPKLTWSSGPHGKDQTTPYFGKPLLWASS